MLSWENPKWLEGGHFWTPSHLHSAAAHKNFSWLQTDKGLGSGWEPGYLGFMYIVW